MTAEGFQRRVYVTGLLSRISRHVHVSLDRRLAKFDLSFAQYVVMVRLWRAAPEPLSQSALAVDLELGRSSLSSLLGTLERAGFAERSSDAADGRRRLVSLTEHGQQMEAAVLEVIDRYEGEVLSGLTDADVQFLRKLLTEVHTHARRL